MMLEIHFLQSAQERPPPDGGFLRTDGADYQWQLKGGRLVATRTAMARERQPLARPSSETTKSVVLNRASPDPSLA